MTREAFIYTMPSMARMKSFFYIIDNLTAERGEAIRQSLKALSEVEDARYSIQQGFIEVRAKKDVEAQLRLACEMFGAGYRTKMKKSDIF